MAYVVNGDEFKSVGNHCITLYVNGNNGSASYDAILRALEFNIFQNKVKNS